MPSHRITLVLWVSSNGVSLFRTASRFYGVCRTRARSLPPPLSPPRGRPLEGAAAWWFQTGSSLTYVLRGTNHRFALVVFPPG